MGTSLSALEEELCIELGIQAAAVCREDVALDLPTVCPLSLATARGMAEDAGIPCAKLDTAAIVVLKYAVRRWGPDHCGLGETTMEIVPLSPTAARTVKVHDPTPPIH